jgi:hypothetical protein
MKHRQPAVLIADLAEGLNVDRRLAVRGREVIRGVPSAPRIRRTVTVIVLSYNYGRFLGPCAESVLQQRDVDLELLIVDDASTDHTPQVTKELADRDSRVTVVRNEINRGQLPSMNAALERVRTEFVVKLDADDLLPPGSLARSSALMERFPEVTFSYGRPLHFSGEVPRVPEQPARSWTVWDGPGWFGRRARAGTNVISQPEVLMRTAAVRQVGPIREDLKHTFDLHLWLQLSLIGDVGRVNGPPHGCYRVHEASLQRTEHAGAMIDLEGRRDAFDAIFATTWDSLSDAETLCDSTHRALAATALDAACRAYDRPRSRPAPPADLIRFALQVYPQARSLPEWRALDRRIAVGPDRARKSPRFLFDAAARRAAETLATWRWRRSGEW